MLEKLTFSLSNEKKNNTLVFSIKLSPGIWELSDKVKSQIHKSQIKIKISSLLRISESLTLIIFSSF